MDVFDIAFEEVILEREKEEAKQEYDETMEIESGFRAYKEFIEEKFPDIILEMIHANKDTIQDKDTKMRHIFSITSINPYFLRLLTEFLTSYGIVENKQKIGHFVILNASLNQLKNAYYTELQALQVREQEISEMVQISGYTK